MLSHKLQSLPYKTQRCNAKSAWTVGQKIEHHRIFIEKSQAEMEDSGQTISAESLVEAELDMEIRSLQAGYERIGSDASQSNECCMDPAFLHGFLTSGADIVRQQMAILQSEFGKTHGMQHQPAPVTPVHVSDEGGEENEEDQRKSASRDNGQLFSGGHNERFLVGSVFDASMLPRNSAGEPRGGDESGGMQARSRSSRQQQQQQPQGEVERDTIERKTARERTR